MAGKDKIKRKEDMSAEELIEGLRRRYGHMPTLASEKARKEKEKNK